MKNSNIKETIRRIIREESDYATFFKRALDRVGKSIPDMSDAEKRNFFNKIDAAWDGEGEKNEGNAFGAAVTAAKEKGEDEFEVGGKTYKVESVNEEKYPIAVEKFNKELIKHPMVKKAAQFYKKTPAEIVKAVQQRLYTKGDRMGNTKEVYIDFKDTTSGITIKHKMKFNESVNEDFKSVVGKTVFSDGKGKLHFGYYKEDDSAYFVDYKTWAKLGMKDVSKGDTNKDKVINSILRNQKQFNKKVDYNMWAKKTNPSFEEKMDWFIKNGWISNITKAGIKEGVESVNEAITVTRIPNFNLESDAYIAMLYLLKNNSGFKRAATNAGIDLFSGANKKTVFVGLHNNLKKVITPKIIKSVVQTLNQKRKVLYINDSDIQKGVHNNRFAGLLALGVIDSFVNDPIDTKLLKDLGNAKLNNLANQFSINRGKMKLGTMLGNKRDINEDAKIKMNNLDWGKSTVERNTNLDKYYSLKTDKERNEFLRKLKGESINELDDADKVWVVNKSKGQPYQISKKAYNANKDRYMVAGNRMQANLYAKQIRDKLNKSETVIEAKKYDIGAGHLGNGTTIWNRAQIKYGDYNKIAHISDNGTLKIYDKKMPDNIKNKLQRWADAIAQGKPVKFESINEAKFYAFYNNKKHEIEGKDLWDAKQKAIKMLKVPKSKVGYLAIVNASEHDRGSYKFESINEGFESISKSDLIDFIKYMNKFYGKSGVYTNRYGARDFTRSEIINALKLVYKYNPKYEWGGGDSVDREMVRDILMSQKKFDYIDESINEGSKHYISVDSPTQISSKSVRSQIEKLAKKGVRSKEIGLKMGFVGNEKVLKAVTDAFQIVKNRVYFDLRSNESINEGLSKDSIVRTLTSDKNAYFLTKDGNGWILDITPKGAQNSTFHQKFTVKDMGKGHLGMKYRLSGK